MEAPRHDVEAFAKTDDMNAVVSLLSRSIGPLVTGSSFETGPHIYECGDISVVLQPSEKDLLSVWIRGSSLWPSHPALARHLAAELGCTVLCDPGAEFPEVSPYSSVFLQIEGKVERLVDWE